MACNLVGQKKSLHIPRQSASSRLFCPIELRDAPKTGPSEDEMLRSLTFIRQTGYGFKPQHQAPLTARPHSGDSGALWEAERTQSEGFLVVGSFS